MFLGYPDDEVDALRTTTKPLRIDDPLAEMPGELPLVSGWDEMPDVGLEIIDYAPDDMIRPADFPELHFIMWDQRDAPEVTPALAYALYRDRWGYVLEHRMQPHEIDLVDRLERQFGAIRNRRAWRRARGAWIPGKPILCRGLPCGLRRP